MIKIKNPFSNPFSNLSWRAVPALVLYVMYAGLGMLYIIAGRFGDGLTFLMFWLGMRLYLDKVKLDNQPNWYEVKDIEE